jgi:hypothetical protein
MNYCFLKKHRRGYWNIFSILSKDVPLCVGWGLLQQEAREAWRGLWADNEPVHHGSGDDNEHDQYPKGCFHNDGYQ